MPVLSLFLLLLAFFILLNSLAQYETTRTRAILGSLNATFNTLNPVGDRHEFGSFVGLVAAADALEGVLDGQLRTLIGVDRFTLIRDGSVLALDVDAGVLFLDGATPAPALADLAARIAGALDAPHADYRIDVEAVARTGDGSVGAAAPEAVTLAASRASALVRALERAGLEPARLLAGVAGGDAARVRVEFRVHESADSGEDTR